MVRLSGDKYTRHFFLWLQMLPVTEKPFWLSVRYCTPELGLKSKLPDFHEDSDESPASIHHQIMNKLKENDL